MPGLLRNIETDEMLGESTTKHVVNLSSPDTVSIDLSIARLSWTLSRLLMVALFLLSSGMKATELSSLTPATIIPQAPVLVLVLCQTGMALWLLSGVAERASYYSSVFMFIILTGIAFYKGISGQPSCGCFGSIKLNPWLMFALDIGITIVLITVGRRGVPFDSRVLRSRASWLSILFAVWIIVLLPASSAYVYRSWLRSSNDGLSIRGNYLFFDPTACVGHQFPLLPMIDVGSRLRGGEWVVVLIHHDCERCQELLRNYSSRRKKGQVAVVQIPPYGLTMNLPDEIIVGRLKCAKECVFTTPVEIALRDSIVVGIEYPVE